MPKALYGVEAAKVNEKLMLALTTAIKNCISKSRPHKDPNMTFATSSHGEDAGPETYIYV